MAPPAVMNYTWFPSQCGPIVLMMTRRSSSFFTQEGKQRAVAHVKAIGDREALAEALGISRRTLYRKLGNLR